MTKKKRKNTGRNPTPEELRDAERIERLHLEIQRDLPGTVKADHSRLGHINTYGSLPDFYIDRPFVCRNCGKREIWKAQDQKWYYEEAKGHIDAIAVECHACRDAGKGI